MTKKSGCVAVDLGASSGRIILGALEESNISLKEIHRFENRIIEQDGYQCWDLDAIFTEIIIGLKKCAETGKDISSIGVDTWGVDFTLLDVEEEIIGHQFAYRDSRTDGIPDEVFKVFPKEVLYQKTGIQISKINTLFQLCALNKSDPESISDRADWLLFTPDYINFRLSGEKRNEFTIASTSQILNMKTREWEKDLTQLIAKDNYNIFRDLTHPGERVGSLKSELEVETGLANVDIFAVASHDTASAVVAIPANKEDSWAFISSGTWSLMGIEVNKPIITSKSFEYNFTNEGGVSGNIRFLKNLMGLWIIQELKKLLPKNINFEMIVNEAQEARSFRSIINTEDERFFNPGNMVEAIQNFCEETNQPIPITVGELARSVYESLALRYREVMLELEEIKCEVFNKIHIVGGGSNNAFLNQLCADFTDTTVYAGPIEATAFGNIIFQYIAKGVIKSCEEGRSIIRNSCSIKQFIPNKKRLPEEKWRLYQELRHS